MSECHQFRPVQSCGCQTIVQNDPLNMSVLLIQFNRSCFTLRSSSLLVPFVLSGIKFIVLADPRQSGIDALLRKIYEIYSDFALKNPFYSLEMPIRY